MTMRENDGYENGEALVPMPHGTTLEDVWRMSRSTRAAVAKCLDHLQVWDGHFGAIMAELSALKKRTSIRPIRADVSSSFDLREFAQIAKSTPDEELEQRIERIENQRMGRRVRQAINKIALAALMAGAGWVGHILLQALKGH